MELLNFRRCMHSVPLLLKCLHNENNKMNTKTNGNRRCMVVRSRYVLGKYFLHWTELLYVVMMHVPYRLHITHHTFTWLPRYSICTYFSFSLYSFFILNLAFVNGRARAPLFFHIFVLFCFLCNFNRKFHWRTYLA